MHVKPINLDSLNEVLNSVQQRLSAGETRYCDLDASNLSYLGLLGRLQSLVGGSSPVSVVVLRNCTEVTLKQLRRIRRNQGKALEDLTVYTVPALSDGSEVSA
ncbi:hypothetical protein D9M71_81050 [compost metagenome]